MSLVAVGVVIGTPNSNSEVPITVSNIAADVIQAQTDLATLATDITTVQGNASAADTDVGAAQTLNTTADTAAGTSVTNATTADTDVGTTGTDFDAFAAALIAITGDTYNSTTKQFTFGGATGLTHAQLAGALGTALNLVGSDQVTAKAATATAKTQATTVKTDVDAVVTSLTTAKTATALTKTNANLLSTTTVATDLTNASTLIGLSQVFIQTDTAHAPNIATLNGALVGALGFMRDTSILPT
jgi:hypothetical protein